MYSFSRFTHYKFLCFIFCFMPNQKDLKRPAQSQLSTSKKIILTKNFQQSRS